MQDMTSEKLYDFFQEHHICTSLTREEVNSLTHFVNQKSYTKGETIADKGDPGDAMFLILDGKVNFVSYDGADEMVVGTQGPGYFIGEISFFDGKDRMLKMEAATKELTLFEIQRDMYDRLRIEHPFLALNLVENVVSNTDKLVRKISTDLSHMEHYMRGYGRH
ncbi:cyclic nucleotide-binding domain-containing protein [Hydrogenovibrio sp. SC-1]|uniref:Crp/Fnr family transcriptional regulator n=1 Tax=Hydrogenovibrio sp. SC-1 TaxID=2065820 RepID=UPI000C7AEAF6|nr:cyclic nucleotide-binding domain-containing protein [Hydrogenovibrio sp. SC-1]PLA74665.1 cyclic nucleotide-binding domain-containing protein [Hydrogenovibrio sp. SC-1]